MLKLSSAAAGAVAAVVLFAPDKFQDSFYDAVRLHRAWYQRHAQQIKQHTARVCSCKACGECVVTAVCSQADTCLRSRLTRAASPPAGSSPVVPSRLHWAPAERASRKRVGHPPPCRRAGGAVGADGRRRVAPRRPRCAAHSAQGGGGHLAGRGSAQRVRDGRWPDGGGSLQWVWQWSAMLRATLPTRRRYGMAAAFSTLSSPC